MLEFSANIWEINVWVIKWHLEPTNHLIDYLERLQIVNLVFIIESQVKTQRASKRPYGVGLLIAGVDDEGPHIFETCPSGNYY